MNPITAITRRRKEREQQWADDTVAWLRSMRTELAETRTADHAKAAGMTRVQRAAARGDQRAAVRWRRWLVDLARWARSAGWGPRVP